MALPSSKSSEIKALMGKPESMILKEEDGAPRPVLWFMIG